MPIHITDNKSTTHPQITIKNRNAFLATIMGIFLVLTYGTLISLLIHSFSDIQKNLINSLFSIVLNLVTAIQLTHLLLYVSLYTTKVSRSGDRIRIRSFGILPGVSTIDVLQADVQDVIFVKSEIFYTANFWVAVTLLLKGSERRSCSFSLPRQALDEALQTLESVLGVRKEDASGLQIHRGDADVKGATVET